MTTTMSSLRRWELSISVQADQAEDITVEQERSFALDPVRPLVLSIPLLHAHRFNQCLIVLVRVRVGDQVRPEPSGELLFKCDPARMAFV